MMQSKGQHLTIEQVFLFTIGLLITIGVFFSFREISDNVTGLAKEDQLEETGALVLSGVQTVSKDLSTTDKVTLFVSVPRRIAQAEYTIIADGEELTVLLPNGENSTQSLEAPGTEFLVSGRVSSSAGGIRIVGSGPDGTIQLTRPNV